MFYRIENQELSVEHSLFQDMGTIIIGKMESGVVAKGQTLTVMPNRVSLLDGSFDMFRL